MTYTEAIITIMAEIKLPQTQRWVGLSELVAAAEKLDDYPNGHISRLVSQPKDHNNS